MQKFNAAVSTTAVLSSFSIGNSLKMAEREELQKRYAYHEMSNKVVQADRSLLPSRGSEPTGEVDSLRGRTDVGRMGDRVAATSTQKRSVELTATIERAQKKKQKGDKTGPSSARGTRKTGGGTVLASGGGQTILDLGNLTGYQPSTPAAHAAYENILVSQVVVSYVDNLLPSNNLASSLSRYKNLIGSRSLLGNQATSVLRDAAEEVVTILRDENLRDPTRHDAISRLLTGKPAAVRGSSNGLSSEQFAQLVQLGKQLDDYEDFLKARSGNQEKEEDKMTDETGVAVVFDESDPEDNENVGDDSDVEAEVVDASSASEDEKDDMEEPAPDDAGNDDDEEEEKITQGGKEASKKKVHHGSDRILSVHEIDAHFLQRQLAKNFDDADVAAKIATDALDILDIRNGSDARECENKLLVLLGFDLFDTIKLLLNNRVRIWACVSLKRAQTEDERSLIEQLLSKESTGEGKRVWDELHVKSRAEDWTRDRMRGLTDSLKNKNKDSDVSAALDSISTKAKEAEDAMSVDHDKMDIAEEPSDEPIELDLEALAFRDGSHTMSNKQCNLPDTAWRAMKKGYEEVHVPAIRSVIPKDEKLVAIAELPTWTQAAFQGMDKLNRVQSRMCDVALYSSENILLCAPTGAGKTNVACLAMLNVLGQFRREPSEPTEDSQDDVATESFDLSSFKIVYVAPMKALVQEVVKNFSERLKSFGVVVRELSGDSSLTRQQISETQLLVTTPEKWDIVTRQGEGRAFTQLVKLVIIDEIHLLHDERGPVLESLVARIIRQVETTAEPIRLVGLSATLPNYADVAAFLRVKPDKGLFFFDHSYRPVPLQMQYVGITERNAFKRFQLQNEICYEKALNQRRNGNQMLIFVHSRAETGKTAKALRDLALERDELLSFVRDGGGSQLILREEAATVKNADLKDVLPYGFAIHHAGMSREDRELVEDLFADRHIAVLCCTATLAWGVNLPAHAVIIKGTQIYDPSKGRWAELSPLDVLQMLGRAGRPQYDSEGEGVILTQHSELQYYLSLTNLQLPVESQLIKTLADHLNAEVVLGTVQNLAEAVDWLSYTFLYIRMLRNPSLYGIVNPKQTLEEDPTLKGRRLDLAHTAASVLEKNHLVRYDRKSGSLQSTPLGRVSSQFYISHASMAVYSRYMRSNMSDIELLRLFSLSGEFAHITVREEEKLELTKLSGRVPIPVKESPSEPSAKVNILLQAYISRLKLDGFALIADMVFIQQSAARIMRALFEIALRRNWSALAKLCLAFSNMITNRIWRSQSPLRQFKNVPEVVARKLERKSDIEWSRYADLTPSDLGELVGVPKMGRVLHKLVQQFPRLEISANIQPITRSMIRVELILVPAFQFDVSVHGYVQLFHVIVEDVNGETILHYETCSLKSKGIEHEQTLVFTVPVLEPLPPAYFIRVISDRWLHSEATLPISFAQTILPAKFPPPTELLDLQPLPPSALGETTLAKLFHFKEFNPIQTQTFHELFKTDRNCLICAPSGSGKTVCAEFAILRMFISHPEGKCVYVAPTLEIAQPIFSDWSERLGSLLGKRKIALLTGETTADLRLLSEAKIIVSTVTHFDMLSRRWKQRKAVQGVSLFIFDELQFLGGEMGPIMEVVISRMRYMSAQLKNDSEKIVRIVGFGASIANAREVGEWMGVPAKNIFNFSPKVRPLPLEIYFQTYDQSNYSARLLAMAKPVYNAVVRHSDGKPTVVFVPSRRQAQLTAIDIMTYHESQGKQSFLPSSRKDEISAIAASLREPGLQQVVLYGVGFLHGGMTDSDWTTVVELFREGVLPVIVCPSDVSWKLRVTTHLVVIMGTEAYDGRERRHIDYPVVQLLHMLGRACRQSIDSNGKCVLLCHTPKKEYLKKLLFEPLPIESHLDHYLHDHFNSEIVTKTIETMQDAVDYITWTFLYRRLPKNPNYYGLTGTSDVHISEHLSEMVETVLGDLEDSKCCQISEDGEVSPLNLGMISAYYYVQYTTIELIASSVTAKTKIRGVLEIVAAASEYSSLPIRFGEEKALKILAMNLTHKLPEAAQYHDPNTKALILLQCHFSRKVLSPDLRVDQKLVVHESVNLIQAVVDVVSSNGWLKPALAAMELSQMVVQGLWNKDNVLKQIPHFTDEIVQRCADYEGDEPIESVFDILTLDEDVRNDILRLPEDKLADVAVFCNNYPNVEVSFKVIDADEVTAGDPVRISVQLKREVDEGDLAETELEALGKVSATLFPGEKREGWWIVVGDTSTNLLYSLKRVNLQLLQKVDLEFMAPEEAGDYNLKLFCMSDSYLGCDQEYDLPLSVAAGGDDENSDEE